MSTRTKNRSPRKKPIVGSRIQQICPAAPGWRALFLLTDEEDDKIVVNSDGEPQYFMEDIAAWAVTVDEGKTSRHQQIWPCIPEASGILDPICPDETPAYIGLVSPSHDEYQIEDMVRELFESLGPEAETVVDDDESEEGTEEETEEEETDG